MDSTCSDAASDAIGVNIIILHNNDISGFALFRACNKAGSVFTAILSQVSGVVAKNEEKEKNPADDSEFGDEGKSSSGKDDHGMPLLESLQVFGCHKLDFSSWTDIRVHGYQVFNVCPFRCHEDLSSNMTIHDDGVNASQALNGGV